MSHFSQRPYFSVSARGRVLEMGLALSHRLQAVALTLLVLMAVNLVAASCTPEPVPYASRVLIQR